jgi:comEA protein
VIKFTKDEKIAIIFLLFVVFIGITIATYKKNNPQFDFTTIKPISKDTSIININKDSKEDITKLPHIGPVTAERIVTYRENVGLFQDKEDIKNVKGIGEKTFSKIKDLITTK